MENKTSTKEIRLFKPLIIITKLSKILALAMFISLPFIGFMLGMKYQRKADLISLSKIQITQQNKREYKTDDIRWTRYSNDEKNFSISLPTEVISSSRIYENRSDRIPTEVISSGDSFPEVRLEISDSAIDPIMPTYFEIIEKETVFIHDRFMIPAEKYFGYIYSDENSSHINYVQYYLIFDRNNQTYLVNYRVGSKLYDENPTIHDDVFEEIVNSIVISGENVIPDSELLLNDQTRHYTTEDYSVAMPPDWNIRYDGDRSDPIIIITNEPISEIYSNKGSDSEYTSIYFSKSGIIFSTSGGVCFNIGCENNGTFATNIDGDEYSSEIILSGGTQNRFILNTKNVYIGAAYPKNVSDSELKQILSTIRFN